MLNINAFEVLHRSIAHAAYEGLEDFRHFDHDGVAIAKMTPEEKNACWAKQTELGEEAWPGVWRVYRPDYSQIEVVAMFLQVVDGDLLDPDDEPQRAYTLALRGPAGDLAVYFNGELGYKMLSPRDESPKNDAFKLDMAKGRLAGPKAARKLYGAQPPTQRRPRASKASAKA